MENTIIGIDRSIDALILTGATDVFAALATPSANLLVLIAGAALALFAARCAYRRSMAIDDFLVFVGRFALIYSLVSGGALWTSYVYPFISQFGPLVGNTLLSSFTAGTNTGGIVEVFADYIALNANAVFGAFSTITFSGLVDGSAISIVLTGLLALAGVLLLAALNFAFILISKVFLAILIAIAPVLLVGSFLKSTSDIANGWVRGVSIILVFQLLVYGVLGLTMGASIGTIRIVESSIDRASVETPDGLALSLLTLAFLSVLSFACTFMCPMFARAVGGANIGFGENKIGPGMQQLGQQMSNLASALRQSRNDPIGPAANAQHAASSQSAQSQPDYKQIDRERGRATAARHANALKR